MPEILDVGLMPYLNSAVFYKRMAPGAANLVEYTPREMALAVERGDLAAGPLPVAEWFRMGEMLTPIGDLCVATRQSSVSILLFGVRMPEEMEGARIAVTEQTATSVQLLRVLLNELWGVEPDALVTRDEPHDAILLIGDEALVMFAESGGGNRKPEYYDKLKQRHWEGDPQIVGGGILGTLNDQYFGVGAAAAPTAGVWWRGPDLG